MSNTIRGKVVVITGASSGLGEATARHLSAEGALIVLGARRADRLQSLADELTANGGKVLTMPTDVTRYDDVQKLVDAAVKEYGRVDVILNNAGVAPLSLLESGKVHEWDFADRRQHQGCAVWHRRGPSAHEATEVWPYHQRRFHRRIQD